MCDRIVIIVKYSLMLEIYPKTQTQIQIQEIFIEYVKKLCQAIIETLSSFVFRWLPLFLSENKLIELYT